LKYILLVLFLFSLCKVFAQNRFYNGFPNSHATLKSKLNEQQWDSLAHYKPSRASALKSTKSCSLNKIVFGWFPYWGGTTYNDFDFSLLSDISYFSYEVNPSNGRSVSVHNWKTTQLVDMAKASGVRISLTVTLFSGHKSFFDNALAKQTLIDSLIYYVKLRGADGVNFDFEAVPGSQRDSLTSFIRMFRQRVSYEFQKFQISMALPAVDWSKAFDAATLSPYIDLFIIMGYDYYYSGSSMAGPVSPKNNGALWAPYDVTRSVRSYLNYIPANKLCLGVPYYGCQWQTNNSRVASATVAKGSAQIYATAVSTSAQFVRKWDENASVPWFSYNSGSSVFQCWFDDEVSLGLKYDMVNAYSIAGIGIWALGYDRSRKELWNAIRQKFSSFSDTATSGSFYDMGGPNGNYFLDDSFSRFLAIGDKVSCEFTHLNLAVGDTLKVFSGTDFINYFTESNTNIIVTSDNGIKFYFNSGQANPLSGWKAHWYKGTLLASAKLSISSDTLSDSRPEGSLVGRLSVTDTAAFSYSLFGKENAANPFFKITGDSVLTEANFYSPFQGKYSIAVVASDNYKRKIIKDIDISILPKKLSSQVSSVSEVGILVYPNPASDFITIQLPAQFFNHYDGKLIDLKGNILKTFNLNNIFNKILLNDIKSGQYILLINFNKSVYLSKIQIVR
jgi:hypothetical protein